MTADLLPLFPTTIYRVDLLPELGAAALSELEAVCRTTAADDSAGRAWSRKKGYLGYTSYASLDDLPWRAPPVAALVRHLDRHTAAFADALHWDLGTGSLVLDALWINILAPKGAHGSHLHPNSVVSGTFYVAMPEGAGALTVEDPRLHAMMAAPPKRKGAPKAERPFVRLPASPGILMLWESYLRHEVPANRARQERISISFNYRWD